MKKARVYIADLTHTGQNLSSECFPLGAACIGAYTKAQLADAVDVEIFKYPEDLISTMEKNGIPDIIGFATYIWNASLSYTLAKEIKQRAPETLVVFGGPTFPTEPELQKEFMQAHPEMDLFVQKEGEVAFADVCKAWLENSSIEAIKRANIPNTVAMMGDEFLLAPLRDRIADVNDIPDPYLNGMMDKFFDERLVPLIQTNRGCPFTCTYCTEGQNYYRKVTKYNTDRMIQQLEHIAKRHGGVKTLQVADANFGMFKEDLDYCKAIAKFQEQYNYPVYLGVSTGKNKKEQVLECAEVVKGALRLSASVQSLDPEVLTNINRSNINTDQIIELAKNANRIQANTYSEIILGLPGDTLEKHLNSIRLIVDSGIIYISLYTLMMLPGTEMNSKKTREIFGMKSRYRVLPRSFGKYSFFGKQINSAEIEEVCVESKSLPFEDYVKARVFALSIGLFYNDMVLFEVISILRPLGISIFDWILRIHNSIETLPADLRDIYRNFENETRNELHMSQAELEAEIQADPKVIDDYISGKLGNNVIFRYRAQALGSAMESVHYVAKKFAIEQLRQDEHKLGGKLDHYIDMIEQAVEFSLFKKKDLLNLESSYEMESSYDFTNFSDGLPRAFSGKQKILFQRDKEQIEVIRRLIVSMGKGLEGFTKIISRFPVKNLYRKPMVPNQDRPLTAAKQLAEANT